jgi:integral membrane protein
MPLGPRPADVPRIRRTVAVYKVSSIITGTFLLLLVLMMVTRYGFGVDIELLGPYGFLTLTPKDLIAGINLSTVILIVHGWLYVLYLACDLLLWRYIRWSFAKFVFIALGGIIPFLSFFLERRVPRDVEAAIAAIDPATAPQTTGATA